MRFQGRSLLGLRPDEIGAYGIARTYQNIRLFGEMTVLENILVGMHPRLHNEALRALRRRRARAMAKWPKTPPSAKRWPCWISSASRPR